MRNFIFTRSKILLLSRFTQLQELNEKLKSASEKLCHAAWVAHQQRVNLEGLTYHGGQAAGGQVAAFCLRHDGTHLNFAGFLLIF